MKRKGPRPLQWLRYSVQVIVALYVLVVVIANTVGQQWAANLHTICPFGGVVNLYTYLVDGNYVAKLHSAVFVMLLALVISLVLTGKSFCGWICPLGSVQQGLGWVGERLWPRAYNKVPRRVERILQYLKWVVLVWVLVQTARSGRLIFQDWDPYYNLYRIWTDEIAITGYIVVALTLLLALFMPRPFCRFACPLGAFNGLFNSFSFVGIKRDTATCTDCGRCNQACPVNIDLCATTTIRSVECMRCLKCVEACPVNSRTGDTLKLRTWFSGPSPSHGQDTATAPVAGRLISGRSVSTWLFAAVAVAAFVLPILVTNVTGDFAIAGGRGGGEGGGRGTGVESGSTQDSTDPGSDQGGAESEGGSTEGGQVIRGSMTLEEIEAMGVDLGAFLVEFGVPTDTPADARLRDLTDEYGFTMSEVRAYLERDVP